MVLPGRLRRAARLRHGQTRDDDAGPVHGTILVRRPAVASCQAAGSYYDYTKSGSARTVDRCAATSSKNLSGKLSDDSCVRRRKPLVARSERGVGSN